MTSKWMRFNKNLLALREDIYPQPMDIVHMRWTARAICMMKPFLEGAETVLDVGCGVGYSEKWFTRIGMLGYIGVTLGSDVEVARSRGVLVYEEDFHFLPWDDGEFDMVFSRHSLEHSPMPLLALKEWHRVSNKYLGLVMPNPEYWGWAGRNHYSVMNEVHIEYLLDISGWEIIMKNAEIPEEFVYACRKKQ